MSTCCARFGAFHDDVAPFFVDAPSLDQDVQSRSRDGERRVTVTARGLFLTRDLAVQHAAEEVFDATDGHHLPTWRHDTALGGLGLAPTVLQQLTGRRVLDVASGLAIVGTELSALGATVDAVDLEIDDTHPSFGIVSQHAERTYRVQLELLQCLARHSSNPRYAMNDDELTLLDRLVALAPTIVDSYPTLSGTRIQDDATELGSVVDRYDLVLCGWLMVHLEPHQEQRAISRMLALTKPGGRVHIRAGYGGDLRERVVSSHPNVSIIDARDDLVVLAPG